MSKGIYVVVEQRSGKVQNVGSLFSLSFRE